MKNKAGKSGGKFHLGRMIVFAALASGGWLLSAQPLLAATKIHNQTTTPLTLTFIGADPDTPVLSVPVTVFFRTTGAKVNGTWSLSVQAVSGPNMINCPNAIPVESIRVSCVSAVADDGAEPASCASPFNLSTGLQTVSSGTEGIGNARPYETIINFTFQDSWRYIATDSACTINLNYQIIAD